MEDDSGMVQVLRDSSPLAQNDRGYGGRDKHI